MSKRKTRAEDIRNPEHYFNRYIALEVKHDQIKQTEYEKQAVSLETEFCEKDYPGYHSIGTCEDELEKSSCTDGGCDWIDHLDNHLLFEAVNCLTARQKKILTMFAMQEMTMQEIADELGVSQPAIAQNISTIRKKLKKVFE